MHTQLSEVLETIKNNGLLVALEYYGFYMNTDNKRFNALWQKEYVSRMKLNDMVKVLDKEQQATDNQEVRNHD